MCLLRRASFVVGSVVRQSGEEFLARGEQLFSLVVGEITSRISSVAWGCVPVSAAIRVRAGALWRAPAPFAVLRTAACMNRHAALQRLMRRASWAGHSPAICVQKSGLRQIGHPSVRIWPYLLATLLLYNWPYMNLSMMVPSVGFDMSLLWIARHTVLLRTPSSVLATTRLRYREVWYKLRNSAAPTSSRSC